MLVDKWAFELKVRRHFEWIKYALHRLPLAQTRRIYNLIGIFVWIRYNFFFDFTKKKVASMHIHIGKKRMDDAIRWLYFVFIREFKKKKKRYTLFDLNRNKSGVKWSVAKLRISPRPDRRLIILNPLFYSVLILLNFDSPSFDHLLFLFYWPNELKKNFTQNSNTFIVIHTLAHILFFFSQTICLLSRLHRCRKNIRNKMT